MNKKLAGLMVAAGVLWAASANATLTPTITTDTPANLDVTWTWNMVGGDVSNLNGSLGNWDAILTTYADYTPAPGLTFKVGIAEAKHRPDGSVFKPSFAFVSGTASSFSSSETYAHGAGYYDTFTFSGSYNGASSTTFHLTGVHAVPEPGEWALMLSGLGLIGVMVRRRSAGRAN